MFYLLQSLTPQKMECIRSQVYNELETTYRQKYLKQEEEAKEAWGTVSKLRYEMSFLKAEYEHDKAQHARQMQELKMHNDLEVGQRVYDKT
jgi:coiled-coil domain-containing protein 41